MPWCASYRLALLRCDSKIRANTKRWPRSDILTGFRISTWPCSMRVADLGSRRVAIWGLGREGRAAIGLLRKHHPSLPLVLLNDAAEERIPEDYGGNVTFAFGAKGIAKVPTEVDVVVKSPGVSLYRDDIQFARKNGVQITSLLNLWFADEPDITTI